MVSKYFSKGREIAIEGKLSTREWKDKDGNRRTSIEMSVDSVHFCGPKPSEGCNAPDVPGDSDTGASFEEMDANEEELPF